jgi:hypothetical protein
MFLYRPPDDVYMPKAVYKKNSGMKTIRKILDGPQNRWLPKRRMMKREVAGGFGVI